MLSMVSPGWTRWTIRFCASLSDFPRSWKAAREACTNRFWSDSIVSVAQAPSTALAATRAPARARRAPRRAPFLRQSEGMPRYPIGSPERADGREAEAEGAGNRTRLALENALRSAFDTILITGGSEQEKLELLES